MNKEPCVIITSGYLPAITGLRAQFLEFLDENMLFCSKDQAAYVRVKILPGQLDPDSASLFVLPADGIIYDPDITDGIRERLLRTCTMANLSADPDRATAAMLSAIDEAAESVPGPLPAEDDAKEYGEVMRQWDAAKFRLKELLRDRVTIVRNAGVSAERTLIHDHGFVYCPKCGRTGLVLRSRSCAEDDPPDPGDPSDYETCSRCDGAGVVSGKAD